MVIIIIIIISMIIIINTIIIITSITATITVSINIITVAITITIILACLRELRDAQLLGLKGGAASPHNQIHMRDLRGWLRLGWLKIV